MRGGVRCRCSCSCGISPPPPTLLLRLLLVPSAHSEKGQYRSGNAGGGREKKKAETNSWTEFRLQCKRIRRIIISRVCGRGSADLEASPKQSQRSFHLAAGRIAQRSHCRRHRPPRQTLGERLCLAAAQRLFSKAPNTGKLKAETHIKRRGCSVEMVRVDPCVYSSFLFLLSDINDCSDQCQNGGTCKVCSCLYQIQPRLDGYNPPPPPPPPVVCQRVCLFVCFYCVSKCETFTAAV